MIKDAQIREALANHAKRFGPIQTILGTVENVNRLDFTCDLLNDDQSVFVDVRLRPVLDGNEALTVFPKIGTWALATRIEGSEDWMLISVGEADMYRAKVGELLFEMDVQTGKFKIENGTTNLKEVITLIANSLKAVLVVVGNNPDFIMLEDALNKLDTLM